MKIGLSMLYCLGRPFSELLEQLRKTDAEHVELPDQGYHAFDGNRIAALSKIVKAKNLKVSVHAPFVDINIASLDPFIRKSMLKRLKKSIALSSKLDPTVWVFHPGLESSIGHFYPDLDWKMNLKSVRELLETAKTENVKIVIENCPDPFPFLLKTAKDFMRFYDELGDSGLDLTIDVGHASINNQIFEFLKHFPNKIVHAHLHDNRGSFDDHLGIGHGNIRWEEVIQAFKRADFKGTLTVESAENVQESLQILRELVRNS